MEDPAAGIARLEAQGLTPLQAAILVAAEAGLAADSRIFARRFGVAHALVLRECSVLIHDLGLLEETGPGNSLRRGYALTGKGRALFPAP